MYNVRVLEILDGAGAMTMTDELPIIPSLRAFFDANEVECRLGYVGMMSESSEPSAQVRHRSDSAAAVGAASPSPSLFLSLSLARACNSAGAPCDAGAR